MSTFTFNRLAHARVWVWLIAFIVLPVAGAIAQPDEEPPVEGSDTQSYDYYDENIDGGDLGDFGNQGADEPEEPKKPEKKPYVRIVMPVDSLTELITYDSVINQDESYYDSLYLRAKRWVNYKWFPDKKAKELAKLYTEDVQYEKFKVKLSVPMKVRNNKYSSHEYGELEFNLTLRFKDGKYKYTITNMRHILPETSDKKDINYVYLEFYMKSEKNVLNYDRYLRAADGAVRKLLAELAKAMREPVEVDEDDW